MNRNGLKLLLERAVGRPDPIGAAYGPSTIESFTPIAAAAPARTQISEDQFKKPLLRVSIQTGEVLESRLGEPGTGTHALEARRDRATDGRRVEKRKEEDTLAKRGHGCKHAEQIMELWKDGARIGQIQVKVKASGKTIRQVLIDNGVTEEEIEARRGRRQRTAPAPTKLEAPAPAAPRPAAEDAPPPFDPVEPGHLELDEEGESPEAVILSFRDWLAEEDRAVQKAIERLNSESVALGDALSMAEAIKDTYGAGRPMAELLRTLRRVTAERLQDLREAS